MKKIKRICIKLFFLVLVFLVGVFFYIKFTDWGFAYEVPEQEAALRKTFLSVAKSHLGANEADGTHRTIIDIYNAHSPLAQGYEVTYTDNWCATFVSAVAIECGLTDIIPTECGCQRQIELFRAIGCWEEDDDYTPIPGDLIYYAWDESHFGDNTGWADHVGIVVGTSGPFLRVIEGNKDDSVCYRTILLGDPRIRGYALPDFASASGN